MPARKEAVSKSYDEESARRRAAQEAAVERDLTRLRDLHAEIVRLQTQEYQLAGELVATNVRGVRPAVAAAIGLSVEALRKRYGSTNRVGRPKGDG